MSLYYCKLHHFSVFFDKTLYSSPLMVVTDQEYSKHYFIEGERVCTKIGSGFGTAPFMPDSWQLDFITGDWSTCSAALMELVGKDVECTGYDGNFEITPNLPPAHNDGAEAEYLQYFYHSDHASTGLSTGLGSASFITDATGYVDQHIQYLPFGELFISQRNSTFDSRYKFTAKELDNETQYTYFGARYYDSDISIWLSVDPLAGKYPSLSPYSYCGGNPILFLDPNGKEIRIYYYDEDNNQQSYVYKSGDKMPNNAYVKRTVRTLNKSQRRGRDKFGVISYFANNENKHVGIYQTDEANPGGIMVDVTGSPYSEYPIPWNPKYGAKNKPNEESYRLSPALVLLHEIAEAYYAAVDPEGLLAPYREIQKLNPNVFDSFEDFKEAFNI